MGDKSRGSMWCAYCQQLVAGQKATHRARSITGIAAMPLTGGLSAAAVKSEGWHCPNCGQPVVDAKIVDGKVYAKGLPGPKRPPGTVQVGDRFIPRDEYRASVRAGDAARKSAKKEARANRKAQRNKERGGKGTLQRLVSKITKPALAQPTKGSRTEADAVDSGANPPRRVPVVGVSASEQAALLKNALSSQAEAEADERRAKGQPGTSAIPAQATQSQVSRAISPPLNAAESPTQPRGHANDQDAPGAHSGVDALERLIAMYRRREIDYEEFLAAKRNLLGLD